MKYEVILKYFKDEYTGEYGFSPEQCLNEDNSFNAFWEASGIFHDVFEHYQEGLLPYYSDKGFMTLWGEMAASGHGIAYNEIDLNSFKNRKYFNGNRDFTIDTIEEIKGAMYEKDNSIMNYKAEKETCLVPYQKPVNSYLLNNTINNYYYQLKEYSKKDCYCKVNTKIENYVYKAGIRRNYIYGYKRALKIIGKNKKHSYNVLNDFIDQWSKICKLDPKNLYIKNTDNNLYGIKFTVSNNGKLRVKQQLIEFGGKLHNINKLNSY